MMKWLSARRREGKIIDSDSAEDAAQIMSDGMAGAAIAGPWAFNNFLDALGDDLGIVELPNVTVPNAVDNQHLTCFASAKLLSVNANSKYPDAALSLAQYITNEHSQLTRYEMTGRVPTALSLASNNSVLSDPVTKAQIGQKEYTVMQNYYLGQAGYWWHVGEFLTDLFGQRLSDESKEYYYSIGFTDEQIDEMLAPKMEDDEIESRLNQIVDYMQSNF